MKTSLKLTILQRIFKINIKNQNLLDRNLIESQHKHQ